jgi:hypothetical protein
MKNKKSRINKKLLIIIGRANVQKGSATFEAMIAKLHDSDITLYTYENIFVATKKNIDLKTEKILNSTFFLLTQGRYRTREILRKVIHRILLIKHPSFWHYFLNLYSESVSKQSLDFKRFIKKQKNTDIYILTHSVGGIIASQVCNIPAIKKLICVGYPFKHPDNPEESYRTHHLQQVKKPILIIQGRDDYYGGESVISRYPLSSSIIIKFIDGEHDYNNTSIEDYADLLRELRTFIDDTVI